MSYYVGNGCFHFKDDSLDKKNICINEMHNVRDMLDGELNRIFVTDDFVELDKMALCAFNNLSKLYSLSIKRLNLKGDIK